MLEVVAEVLHLIQPEELAVQVAAEMVQQIILQEQLAQSIQVAELVDLARVLLLE
jgi:hypothetical protein